jgi:hypothetical protein
MGSRIASDFTLQQTEGDFDGRLRDYRTIARDGGPEFPARHGGHGLLIETETEASQHADVGGMARGIDVDRQNDGSLPMCLAGFV